MKKKRERKGTPLDKQYDMVKEEIKRLENIIANNKNKEAVKTAKKCLDILKGE